MTPSTCFELCRSVFQSQAAPLDLKEAALRALGSVMLACPDMLKGRSCQPILAASLKPEASPALKRAALNIVLELLNADEEKLGNEQKRKEQGQTTEKSKAKGRSKKKSEAVPVINGEQDSISITSSIVQVGSSDSPSQAIQSQLLECT